MDPLLYLMFVLTSMALILVPGPNVLVIISTSISHNVKRGLQTVLGTSSAMALQLLIAACGTTLFVESISKGFEWLKWLGIAYLIYLGIQHLVAMGKNKATDQQEISASGSFTRGFIVSLTNPKTILFFGAFLPQFVSSNGDYMSQIALLSITFLFLATLFDGLYAILAGKLRKQVQRANYQKAHNGVSGILFLSAGIWLALMRKE